MLALVAAAFLMAAPGVAAIRWEFATVGNLVARRAEGRTLVIVPIAGPIRMKLSEPFRTGNRWRLYLTIEDARFSIGGSGRPKRPEGVLSLSATEVSGDVRITIEVAKLGDYGARRSEEGLIVWIDDEPRPAASAAAAASGLESVGALAAGGAEPAPEPADGGAGWGRSLLLTVVAGGLGWAVRYVRRNGVPDWAASQAGPRLRELVFGRASNGNRPPDRRGNTPIMDPRGRSAEIGDAFRVEPEKPPSGIGGLTRADEGNR
jgi:hypothetical protein